MNYLKLFNQIDEDDYIEDECECEHSWENTNYNKVCIKCGVTLDSVDVVVEMEYDASVNNPHGDLTTYAGGSYLSKYRSLAYVKNNWRDKYDYRFKTYNNVCDEFKILCKHFNLPDIINEYANLHYKGIYSLSKIESRNSKHFHRYGMYVYCIERACREYEYDLCIYELLKYYKVSILAFNNAVSKSIDDDGKFYLNKHIIPFYESLNKAGFEITIKEIIIIYNKYLLIVDTNISVNTLLKGSLYVFLNNKYPKTSKKTLYKLLKTSKDTIHKFLVEL